MTISTERLREMLAACDKATPGQWYRFGSPSSDELVGNEGESAIGRIYAPDDLSHVANCEPDTIRSIITELLSTRSSGAEGREEVRWRDETDIEHIARDIKEGRFPKRSERKQRPDIDDAWDRIKADPELDRARSKLSLHELRRIINHSVKAYRALKENSNAG